MGASCGETLRKVLGDPLLRAVLSLLSAESLLLHALGGTVTLSWGVKALS